ncbi:MAG TPA: hypothetical protein VGK73_38520 [Polyangiaceae bacterium]
MSQKKRNAPRSPSEVLKALPATEGPTDSERQAVDEHRGNTLQESLDLVQHARELEARRGRTNALPEGAFALQRLLIALLETLTPEQRAEVRRRLGE